ncbi:MAG: DUF308 domain-containing protein [Bacteroidales bacterium]|jgi:uncharacterized membrane protein HdeD (DUF308 family)|nr:DUF308 domain-containing protein [Bacteroidales bacterium]
MKTIIEEVKDAVQFWWLSLILGILFVGLGIVMMFTPGLTYIALAFVFSIGMFVGGFFEIIFSISNSKTLSGWGWYLASGIIDLLFGILLMSIPGLSMAIIPFLLAFWFMFRGFSVIGFSIDLHQVGNHNWGWYLVFGILTILCAIAIIFYPSSGALISVYIAAFAFLFVGIFRIMLSFELKNLKNNNHKLREQLRQLL